MPEATETNAAVIAVLTDAHAFIIEAVLENVRIEGHDPNGHMTAARIRKAVEILGGDPNRLLDERRGTPAIGDDYEE